MASMKQEPSQFPPAQQRLMEFIRREFRPGYNHYDVSKLVGDASARQYFRYISHSRQSFVLAVYPESFDPDHFDYREVYDLFCEIGLPVPQILVEDGPLGIVLQEDLGDHSLQRRLLSADEAERKSLLCQAIDHIICIQQEGSRALTRQHRVSRNIFDVEKLNGELTFFRRHYLNNYRKLELDGKDLMSEEFRRLAAELAHYPRFLCHRDYHVRNLILKEDRVYVIDFQDARWGPSSYDLVSLLKDSIELEADEVAMYQDYYLDRSPTGQDADFDRHFHLMCIQRLLKALGTYGYQTVMRGHFSYEQYMKGSLHRALLSLQAVPEFPYIQTVVENELNS